MPKLTERGRFLRINAPEWYERKDFLEFLTENRPATWHVPGPPNECSDIFVTYDHGEGSDESVIPEDCWDEIRRIAEAEGFTYGLIWITNFQE